MTEKCKRKSLWCDLLTFRMLKKYLGFSQSAVNIVLSKTYVTIVTNHTLAISYFRSLL
jgi:hypothetical protein